ncbi:uncharacterized protein ATNIH1004_004783 [Aspergillus tanneri]|uniref:Uncharacterized protein n=1 Tax=Aspergillus tanneri TaxID=1220188 RepID=A0A5M9MSK8_9EURO|nr:uncharacterized protein ATNIH1004_004783 [Aspergillus tanneri]KAA8648896.1 hypothetical protein ATNIH1004_004783 [Aspergillus tanneri]
MVRRRASSTPSGESSPRGRRHRAVRHQLLSSAEEEFVLVPVPRSASPEWEGFRFPFSPSCFGGNGSGRIALLEAFVSSLSSPSLSAASVGPVRGG